MPDDVKNALREFVLFAKTLHGDEKSEAQTFLDHFFRALGHKGVIEAGATFEFRVAKKPGSPQLELIKGSGARAKGGKKFADLLWPDRVLIEMKSRGEKLEKHYDQTFEYWTHIVPHRPPFVILCNFDEFWIYDFNTQLFDPVDRLALRELPENIASFNFLLPIWKKPVFGNNRVEVTRKAADEMATVFREIIQRGEDRQRAQRFILQLLVAMVAEDIGLLPREIVTDVLYECAEKGASSYDLVGGLFRQMATDQPARAGRFTNVQYFNGGLFEVVDPIELKRAESYRLHEAARHNDWSKVRPEIFGTLFQDSMDKKERHAYGGHFTSEFDIRKVVGPTIVRPWRERIDAAGKNVGDLRKALADLRKFRVLDPACGSGNFLFIAYREMKRLERDILLRLREVSKREPLESAISLHQFFGIDIIPFAVELAKVTLMLAKELELIEAQKLAETDQLLIEEKPLPLDNLDKNIICADALFTEWPKTDAIIGNPPFQSKNKIQQGDAAGEKRLTFQRGDALESPWETFELPQINSALSSVIDVAGARRLKANSSAQACFQGQTHGHEGFLLTALEAQGLLKDDPRNSEVIFPYLTGDELVGSYESQPGRYVIDFHPRDVIESSSFHGPFERIKASVLPARQKAAEEEATRNAKVLRDNPDAKVNRHHANFLKRWWLLSYARAELIALLRKLPRYAACARVSKRPIFEFVASTINPSDVVQVSPFSDNYSFGILDSDIHWLWFTARCSTLGSGFRYTSDTVFDSFAWPQSPTREQIKAVGDATVALRALRRDTMQKLKYSLRDLYRPLDQPGNNPLRDAHARLDAAVRAAYGMTEDVDPLAFLLELNLACAAKEKAGEKITPPGLPLPPAEHVEFISEDCIQLPHPS